MQEFCILSSFGPFRRFGPLGVYLLFLCLSSIGLAAWLLYSETGLVSVWATAALAVIAAVAERGRMQLGPVEASVSLLATVFAAVLFGPLAAMLVAAASMSGDFGRPFMRWAVYTSSRATTGALTGMVAVATLSVAPQGFGGITGLRRRCSVRRSPRRGGVYVGHVATPVTCTRQGRAPNGWASSRRVSTALRSHRCAFGLCVPRSFSLDTPALLRTCLGRPAALCALRASARTH